jgi:programmed cell death 6-interacting protein
MHLIRVQYSLAKHRSVRISLYVSSIRIFLALSYGLFERAAVLFNIGALMSQIAAAQSLGTDEELKSAAKLFQQSAGCFAHLKDFVLTLAQQDLTPDLMPDTLHAIFVIMIAQGQEAVYMKASKGINSNFGSIRNVVGIFQIK